MMTNGYSLWSIGLGLLAVVAVGQARAETVSAPVVTPHARAQLIALDRGQDGRVALGLRLTLKPGWHTYWRNPGDSGEPPTLRLSTPQGAAAALVGWPVPERIDVGGIISYGHHGDTLFVARATLPAGATRIEADATWLVCEKVCVPESGRFKLDLASGEAADRTMLDALDRLKPALPAGVEGVLTREDSRLRLSVSVAKLGGTPIAAYFFPYQPDVIDHSARQDFRVADGTVALDLTPFDARARPPFELSGLLEIEIDAAGGRRTVRYELLARSGG